MSERLARHSEKSVIEEEFQVSTHRDEFFEPDYNISPGSLMPVVYEEQEERKIYNFQWGLIPENADAESEGKKHYQAKSEEVEEDEWLSECFGKRRCIVPANGFYKWKTSEKKSTPFYIRLLAREIAGFAGLYSVWQSGSGRDVYSFTLLTTQANALVQPVDDRMPVILQPDDYEQWLNKDADAEDLKKLLQPLGMTEMAVNRVSEKVADLNSQGPELIQPIPK
ncbi:SOS response-associated peptidase [Balneolaceae bacterium YR4-1]|uniref:Abasic site processing protein n=1 Tax=Halalkalibaculum roseum TaxID=2709311 RepID=A0A6M1T766_9BACT|nr:SOS response-associated peptidase [Halalkalibaculum roseum]NGP77795.1 SOS response-associated peptidase [Halalkalibaculum roseum]